MDKKQLPEDTTRGEKTTLAHRDKAGLPVPRRELAVIDAASLEHADKIFIDRLEVFANHGVYPAENELGQKFMISATLYADLRRAGETDDLDASINYGEVCHDIDAFLRGHTFKLIERVAEATAQRLLADYPSLLAVRIKVEKPWAPIGLPLSNVGVEMLRTR